MSEVTDIPDWTFDEAGAQYGFSNPQPALYQDMWAKLVTYFIIRDAPDSSFAGYPAI